MEWLGLLSLILIFCYVLYPSKIASYPNKIKKLEKQIERLQRGQEEDLLMSKIIAELVGKECNIETEEFGTQLNCNVIDVDEEWIKFTYQDKKSGLKTRIIRIDAIDNIELIS